MKEPRGRRRTRGRGGVSVLLGEHDSKIAKRLLGVGRVLGPEFSREIVVDPMKRGGTESCPYSSVTRVIDLGAPPMRTNIDTHDVCCVALELSKTSWVIAFAPPGDAKVAVHKIKAGDVDRLVGILDSSKTKVEKELGRSLQIVLCYEIGYDGFWLARLLIEKGIRTVVFDPASFLMPRRGRRAKTDRLDAEGMTRTLRAWLAGDREVARDVQIPSIEQEDAKRIERERKYLVEERISIVGRIKGLLALHGIWLTGKRIGKGLRERLDTLRTGDGRPLAPFLLRTGDGRPLAPFLRRDIERMLRHYDFISQQIEEVVTDRKQALADKGGKFPQAEKVERLSTLRAVGETTATVLVAEVYHRKFETRRHVAPPQ